MINYHELRQQSKQYCNCTTLPYIGILCAFLVALVLLLCSGCVYASEPVNIEKLANAVYLAEGGAKTRHPYGILSPYRHTTARQACINTIKHRLRDYQASITHKGRGDFITYLGGFYAPIGVANDPNGLNRNWVKNVRYWYEKN